MCSAMPTPGTAIKLRVSFVEVHAETPLVRLWGLSGEWRELYTRLRDDIQAAPGPRLAGAPGCGGGGGGAAGLSVGDLGLVELGGRWLRCRVVGRLRSPGQDYRVFLLDEGRTVSTGAYYLSRGREEFFHLPSEVLGCILADLVPPGNFGAEAAGEPQGWRGGGSNENRVSFGWTAGAVEFLCCLHGKEVTGLVREVLNPQRLVVLELPWLLAQMHHLGLAIQISPAAFRALLNASLGGNSVPPDQASLPPTPQVPTAAPTRGQLNPGSLDYFYPKLELNVTESVLVTQICDPHRVYCQLRSLSKEICRLSDVMSQAFEEDRGEDLHLPSPGSPCAARGIDGRWYRALLLEIYPRGGLEEESATVAQVICVDYGRKEFVTKKNLRHLPAQCFRMPVVTHLCSLQGITDGGCGWTRSQISELKTMLLGKAVQAHIEAYCAFEHVYYVTIWGEEGFNLNCLFGVQACCLTQRYVHSHQGYTCDVSAEQEGIGAPAKKEPLVALAMRTPASLPSVHLKTGEYHKVQVLFLKDPNQFSMCLQEYHQPLCHLNQNLQDFYSQSKKLEGILLEPQPGSLCCVMSKENSYHRAIVTSVQGEGVEVYLLDRGNREIVDLYKVKELLPQFRELPAVALRCALANPSSGQPWSPGSVDYFKKAVLNKELVMQVLSMKGDIYIVELFDHSLAGEKNLAKRMSQGKCFEHHDDAVSETTQKRSDKPLRRNTKEQGASQNPSRINSAKYGETSVKPDCSAHCSTKVLKAKHQAVRGISSLPSEMVAKEDSKGVPNRLPHLLQNYSEVKPGLSCEGQLEVGSTVDVTVSYIESPSLFWCQLTKTSNELRTLMSEIQRYCIHAAQPYDWSNPVCLAKYSEDEKWYRALIVHTDCPTRDVEVVYVDYGNKELVSVEDLRSIRTAFLQLEAQAFRCSLYSLIQPYSQDPFFWDEKATDVFQEFVDSASKMELKCTIFALAALNNAYVLNIVDLITPFETACNFLTRKGFARAVEPEKPLASSVHLLSYYYSTHDIKIGSEEMIYVTYINDLHLFYCQLARCTHVLDRLTDSIGKLSKTGHSLKSSPVLGSLYLAKYTDGCWYRAILAKASPTKEVFFVDFGNTESLAKEDLILVPRDAYEILLLPMQAIKCSLSDIASVPTKAIDWFEKAVLDKPLKALIVAKEPDGKLIVELYDDKVQINAKLKEGLDLQGSKRLISSAENNDPGSKTRPFSAGVDHSTPQSKRFMAKNVEFLGSGKPSTLCRDTRPFQQKTKPEVIVQSPLPVESLNQTDPVGDKSKHYVPLERREEKTDSLKPRNQNESCTNSSLKKVSDLPPRNISSGLKTFVYVSHVNNPFDFYVQLEEDQSLLDHISEKLSQAETAENLNGLQLYAGDLICAIFPEDGLWYRAVVQKKLSDELVSVQYIDYGNTAVVNICKTCRLLEDLTLFPAVAIHCSLSGIKTTGLPEWTEEVGLCFSQTTSEIQMNSEFVGKLEGKWEIILCDGEGNVTADLVNSNLACKKSVLVEIPDKNETEVYTMNSGEIISDKPSKPTCVQDAKSFFWKTPVVGQTVKAFARTIKSPGYFWCQFSDLYDMCSIEKEVQDARKLAICNTADIKIGYSCLTKCSQDEFFNRSVVISVEENTLRVAHIDRGTEELVNKEMLRDISDELLTLPPQAFPCCLFGFNASEESWVEGTNDIFCNKIMDSLLDITVMEILYNGPFEIPLFVVNLECQRENINVQMKPFWKPNVDDSGAVVANILCLEGQPKDTKAEDLEVVLCGKETPTSTSGASEDTRALEDSLCASEPFCPIEDCATSARNTGLCETKGNESPATFETLDTGEQQTIPETPDSELDCSIPKRENDCKMCVLNCSDVSEAQLPVSSERELLGQNPSEAQEARGQKATLTRDPSEVELPGSDSSDSVLLELPLSSDSELLLTKPEALKICSSESLVELDSILTHFSCEEMGETSKLGSVEVPGVERKLEQSPLLMDEIDCWLSCPQERLLELPVPTAPLLLAAETEELSLMPSAPPPAVPESWSSLSASELNSQAAFYAREAVDLCEIGQDVPVLNSVKRQDVLAKNSEQAEMEPVMCRGFEESGSELAKEDSASSLQVGEQAEASSQSAEKSETPLELKVSDAGSKCMVGTEEHGYEAQILGVSADTTKVLTLSSGNEETASPKNDWNGIPEQKSGPLEQMLNDSLDTSLSLSEYSSTVEAAKEEISDSENHADPLELSDQQQ